MSTIVTRAGKGSALTHNEVDANFNNLNNDKIEAAQSVTLTNKTISGSNNTLSNIGNSSLTNSSVTIGSTSVSLGSTATTVSSLTLSSPTVNTPTLSGGTINNASVGATTPSTGAFTTLSATGVTTVQAGTAAAPAITTSGDTNTGIFYPAADTVAIGTGGTERLRVDSAGNAGLGVTPSAWGAGYKAIQISTNGVLYNTSGNNYFGSNVYNDGTNLKRITTAAVGLFGVESGNVYKWYQAASDTAGTNITLTTAMTLDASGNLVLGTTASLSSAANRIDLTINGTSSAMLSFGTGGTRRGYTLHDGTDFTIASETAGALRFLNNAAERARITSGGVLLVGTTSDANLPGSGTSNATGIAIGGNQIRACRDQYTFQIGATTTGAGVFLQQFFQAGTNCGQITVSNSNATAYQTSSDYRLKDNPQPMIGALEKVAALNPCTWTWKNTGDAGQGFIAHEVQQYFPDAVSGEKDGVDENGNPVYQGIDTSFLVATLTAAIQELKAELDATKAEVAALKGNA